MRLTAQHTRRGRLPADRRRRRRGDRGEQVPWTVSGLSPDLIFSDPASARPAPGARWVLTEQDKPVSKKVPPAPPPKKQEKAPPTAEDKALWQVADTADSVAAYRIYLEQFPMAVLPMRQGTDFRHSISNPNSRRSNSRPHSCASRKGQFRRTGTHRPCHCPCPCHCHCHCHRYCAGRTVSP